MRCARISGGRLACATSVCAPPFFDSLPRSFRRHNLPQQSSAQHRSSLPCSVVAVAHNTPSTTRSARTPPTPNRNRAEGESGKKSKSKDSDEKPHKPKEGDKKHKEGDKKEKKSSSSSAVAGGSSSSKKDKDKAAAKPGAPPPPQRRLPPQIPVKKGAPAADDYLAGMDLPSSESEGEDKEEIVREDKGPLNLQVGRWCGRGLGLGL